MLGSYLHIKRPFAGAHDGFTCAIFPDAVDVHLRGADHEVNMGEAGVPASGIELFICQLFAAGECEAIGAPDRDMTGGILIEERVVEEMSASGNGGAGRDQRHFAQAGARLRRCRPVFEGSLHSFWH